MTTNSTDKPAMRSAEDWADGTNVPPQFIRAIQQDAIASQRAEPQDVPFNGKIGLAGGVRLAWGCSIHDAVQAACIADGISENRAREIAYKATGDARERFEKTPANAELERFSSVSKPQAYAKNEYKEAADFARNLGPDYLVLLEVNAEFRNAFYRSIKLHNQGLAAAPKPEEIT